MELLRLEDAMGIYDNSVEFQIERTLVWVITKDGASRTQSVLDANEMLPLIWESRLEAAACAERAVAEYLRKEVDVSHLRPIGMDVRGIWLDPVTCVAGYDICTDPDFSSRLPDALQETYVLVRRDATGAFAPEVVDGA